MSESTALGIESLEIIGRSIDRLITLDMRISSYSRGVISHLYDAACIAQGGGPLSLRAARILQERLDPADIVFIVTGAMDPVYLPFGETDGPPGAVSMAAALGACLGAVPVLLTEAACVDNLAHTANAAGLTLDVDKTGDARAAAPLVLALDCDDTAGFQAKDYLDRYKPKVVIAIEKLGPNALGIAHTASGKPTAPNRARAEELIDAARDRGIVTIGIGDNGNEIGFGLIADAVRHYKPYGERCQCPCGGGIATRVATDVLVPAGTSNWGAYGVVAALAALSGMLDIIHSPAQERQTIQACIDHGAADGSTGLRVGQVDGNTIEVQMAIVTILHAIVADGLATPPARPF